MRLQEASKKTCKTGNLSLDWIVGVIESLLVILDIKMWLCFKSSPLSLSDEKILEEIK